jgi:hypothetical protein
VLLFRSLINVTIDDNGVKGVKGVNGVIAEFSAAWRVSFARLAALNVRDPQ